MKRRNNLPLFWKFTIAIVFTIILFGSVNLYFINRTVYRFFEKEIAEHGISTGKGIAERSIDNILYDDLAVLNKIVSENKELDHNIAYIFIVDKNLHVLAHSFDDAVSNQLIYANVLGADAKESTVIINIDKNQSNEILDIAVPILLGNMGTVRIGLYKENYFKSVKDTARQFYYIVVVFLIIGIAGAFILSYVITKPLNIINSNAEQLNLDNFKHDEELRMNLLDSQVHRIKNLFMMRDEIDVLSHNFYNMVVRLHKAYSELQMAQLSLFQSEKMSSIGILVAGICHEVRNPVAGIKNCIWRLRKEPENLSQNIEYLDLMSTSIETLDSVVSRLLDFSRQHDLQFHPIAIKPIIEQTLLLISFELEKANISISKDFPVDVSNINASSNHIEQVVLNILLNSIDAINDRKLTDEKMNGTIHLQMLEDESNVILKIKDNGIGVPEEKINSLFDPFYTLKESNKGTGLGLSICYNIITAHKGSIQLENNEDFGLEVTISLPKQL